MRSMNRKTGFMMPLVTSAPLEEILRYLCVPAGVENGGGVSWKLSRNFPFQWKFSWGIFGNIPNWNASMEINSNIWELMGTFPDVCDPSSSPYIKASTHSFQCALPLALPTETWTKGSTPTLLLQGLSKDISHT